MRTSPTSLLTLSLAVACGPRKVPLRDAPGTDTLAADSAEADSATMDSSGRDTSAADSADTDRVPCTVTEETIPDPVYDHVAVLLIDTDGASIGDGDKTDAWMEVIQDHDGTLTDLDSAPRTWDGPIGIEVHGSSSTGYPKLGYRFETRDLDGEDVQTSLLGLPDGTDWVLHGPYCDKTLIRNAFAYTLGRTLGEDTGAWQPRTAFVELFLNGSYNGVYLVVERVQRDEDRVDIAKVPASSTDGDLSGGYIVKVDQHRSDGWDTSVGTEIDWVYPHASALTTEQDAYLTAYFDAFESMLAADGWDDPSTGYAAWIATDTWVDHLLVNELANNIDAYRLSAYLYKDADPDGGLLYAGPLWDFDRAFGNVNYCYAWGDKGWIYDELDLCGYAYQYPFWWQRLLKDPAFTAKVRCRWDALRTGVLSDAALGDTLDTLADEVAEVEPRDAARWDNIGVYVEPNYYVGTSWDDELSWLRAWVFARTEWMDANLPGTCTG